MDEIDKRWITDEFLVDYFYDKNTFQKVLENRKQSRIALLEEIYINYKKEVNRARRGLPGLNDCDIRIMIEKAKGKVYLPKI